MNDEDLLPTVQVGDDEGWNSTSDPVSEEEGADADLQKIDSTVLGDFFGHESERGVLTGSAFLTWVPG